MNIEQIRDYCLHKKAVTESLPFDKDTLVFKVGSKMFCLMSLEKYPVQINLKCNPDEAILLREKYSQITPGYHMNKKHWNSILIDDFLTEDLIKKMIDDSYNLVMQSMTRKERETL